MTKQQVYCFGVTILRTIQEDCITFLEYSLQTNLACQRQKNVREPQSKTPGWNPKATEGGGGLMILVSTHSDTDQFKKNIKIKKILFFNLLNFHMNYFLSIFVLHSESFLWILRLILRDCKRLAFDWGDNSYGMKFNPSTKNLISKFICPTKKTVI